MRTPRSILSCLFLISLSCNGMVRLPGFDAGLDAAPLDASQPADATIPDGLVSDGSVPDSALLDASSPVDATIPDASMPGCDQVVRLDRNEPMELESLAFVNGTVRGNAYLFLGSNGAGIVGGTANDYIEANPGERMRFVWSPGVRSVRYTLTGGIDGNQNGSVTHTRSVNGSLAAMPSGTGYETLDVPGTVNTMELAGYGSDGIRVGTIRYSICP